MLLLLLLVISVALINDLQGKYHCCARETEVAVEKLDCPVLIFPQLILCVTKMRTGDSFKYTACSSGVFKVGDGALIPSDKEKENGPFVQFVT